MMNLHQRIRSSRTEGISIVSHLIYLTSDNRVWYINSVMESPVELQLLVAEGIIYISLWTDRSGRSITSIVDEDRILHHFYLDDIIDGYSEKIKPISSSELPIISVSISHDRYGRNSIEWIDVNNRLNITAIKEGSQPITTTIINSDTQYVRIRNGYAFDENDNIHTNYRSRTTISHPYYVVDILSHKDNRYTIDDDRVVRRYDRINNTESVIEGIEGCRFYNHYYVYDINGLLYDLSGKLVNNPYNLQLYDIYRSSQYCVRSANMHLDS